MTGMFYKPASYFEGLDVCQSALALPQRSWWRQQLGDWLLLMAQSVYGFDAQSFERVKRATLGYEREIPSRAPRGRWPAPSFQFPGLVGKTDAEHIAGASGTISLYSGIAAGDMTDTDEDIIAFNRFATIEINKWVIAMPFPWGYELIAAECPT